MTWATARTMRVAPGSAKRDTSKPVVHKPQLHAAPKKDTDNGR